MNRNGCRRSHPINKKIGAAVILSHLKSFQDFFNNNVLCIMECSSMFDGNIIFVMKCFEAF